MWFHLNKLTKCEWFFHSFSNTIKINHHAHTNTRTYPEAGHTHTNTQPLNKCDIWFRIWEMHTSVDSAWIWLWVCTNAPSPRRCTAYIPSSKKYLHKTMTAILIYDVLSMHFNDANWLILMGQRATKRSENKKQTTIYMRRLYVRVLAVFES